MPPEIAEIPITELGILMVVVMGSFKLFEKLIDIISKKMDPAAVAHLGRGDFNWMDRLMEVQLNGLKEVLIQGFTGLKEEQQQANKRLERLLEALATHAEVLERHENILKHHELRFQEKDNANS